MTARSKLRRTKGGAASAPMTYRAGRRRRLGTCTGSLGPGTTSCAGPPPGSGWPASRPLRWTKKRRAPCVSSKRVRQRLHRPRRDGAGPAVVLAEMPRPVRLTRPRRRARRTTAQSPPGRATCLRHSSSSISTSSAASAASGAYPSQCAARTPGHGPEVGRMAGQHVGGLAATRRPAHKLGGVAVVHQQRKRRPVGGERDLAALWLADEPCRRRVLCRTRSRQGRPRRPACPQPRAQAAVATAAGAATAERRPAAGGPGEWGQMDGRHLAEADGAEACRRGRRVERAVKADAAARRAAALGAEAGSIQVVHPIQGSSIQSKAASNPRQLRSPRRAPRRRGRRAAAAPARRRPPRRRAIRYRTVVAEGRQGYAGTTSTAAPPARGSESSATRRSPRDA